MLRNTLQFISFAVILMSGTTLSSLAQETPPASNTPQAVTTAPPVAKAAPATKPATPSAVAPKAAGQKPPSAPAASAAPVQPAMQPPAASPDAVNSADSKVSTEALEPKKIIWPFSGMGGYVDKQAAQRGFQIYSQVCSACHSMDHLAYRNLKDIGFSEAEIKAIAAQKQVEDYDDNGQRIQRPGKPFDHFVPPFANEKASRAANNGAYPPDLSLIVKAREYGPDYVYSILTGFGNPPANEPAVANKYYNPYFQGHWISMPPPLHDGAITYQDGTNATVDQMARDVVTFLQWAAEPEMEARHEMGIKVLIFLAFMAGIFYVAKKRVWKNLKNTNAR